MKALATAFAAALFTLTAAAHAAEGYPSKVIRLVVPLAPGGTGDTLARTVGEEMGKVLGTNIVVDNRPGAGGLIGTETVATAAPDGYTLINVTAPRMSSTRRCTPARPTTRSGISLR